MENVPPDRSFLYLWTGIGWPRRRGGARRGNTAVRILCPEAPPSGGRWFIESPPGLLVELDHLAGDCPAHPRGSFPGPGAFYPEPSSKRSLLPSRRWTKRFRNGIFQAVTVAGVAQLAEQLICNYR